MLLELIRVALLQQICEGQNMLTVQQVAKQYGVSGARVRACIAAGQLIAVKAHDLLWVVDEKEAYRWHTMRRPTGRPVGTGKNGRKARVSGQAAGVLKLV